MLGHENLKYSSRRQFEFWEGHESKCIIFTWNISPVCSNASTINFSFDGTLKKQNEVSSWASSFTCCSLGALRFFVAKLERLSIWEVIPDIRFTYLTFQLIRPRCWSVAKGRGQQEISLSLCLRGKFAWSQSPDTPEHRASLNACLSAETKFHFTTPALLSTQSAINSLGTP